MACSRYALQGRVVSFEFPPRTQVAMQPAQLPMTLAISYPTTQHIHYKCRKSDRRSGRGKSIIEHDGHFAVYDGLWEDDMRSGQVSFLCCELEIKFSNPKHLQRTRGRMFII
jgi:hypothetical protein